MSDPRRDAASPAADPAPVVSVVVPLHDEEQSLPELLSELSATLRTLALGYEIVAVDDGSTDGSLAILRAAATEDPHLRVLSAPRCRGQSAALAAGFRAARAPVVVTLDADLQNDPADIPRLLDALAAWDVVSGIRTPRRDTWVRRASSRVANTVRRRVLGDGVRDVGCSLKAYRRSFLDGLPPLDGMHRFLPALASLQGARVGEIEVRHRPRRYGRSKYGIGNRLGRGILDLLGMAWLRLRWVELDAYVDAKRGPTKELP